MGNSQTSATKAVGGGGSGGGNISSSSATFGDSIKSRRGSKVKVFGLLSQKKLPKEATTPTTPIATEVLQVSSLNVATPATANIFGHVESINEEAELHKKHNAISRQLEFEQMEIRRKQKATNESELFSRCMRDISVNSYRPEKVPVHKKRTAPKPPAAIAKTITGTAEEDNTYLKTTRNRAQTVIDNEQLDHCEFIENLFDSTIKLEILKSNEGTQQQQLLSKAVLGGNTNKLDQDVEIIQNNNNFNKRTTPTTLVAAKHETIKNVSTKKIRSQYTKNVDTSQTIPTSTGKKMPQDDLTFKGGEELPDQQLKVESRQHYAHFERDLSSSSDSLFTDPLTPSQSTTSITAPVGSTAEPCSTADEIDDDDENSDASITIDDEDTLESYVQNRNQTHISTAFCTKSSATQLPSTLREITANRAALTTKQSATSASIYKKENQRPLSDISINSGDTSGILSPTTAKAILELQQRHQADKLSVLSIAKTTYLELLPSAGTEFSPELGTESPDEQMALHLGKKLAQVLGGGSGNGSGNGNSNSGVTITGATGTAGSPMQENLTCCSVIAGTNELFNIAKAKKIELPSLSSRLVATAPLIPTSTEVQTTTHTTASTDAKHLPSLQSATVPTYSSLASANNTAATATETQSTVIISFKSSQTPVQSQPPFTSAGVNEHPQFQQQSEQQYSTAATTTPLYNDDTKIETMTHTPLLSLANSSNHSSSVTQMGSPNSTKITAKNNVLKKVASFTIEKSAGSSGNNKNNNGDSTTGMLGQLEFMGSKRSTFVPEKLSFAAYEKFEGQMLMKWFISSLQSHNNHLSEQDINMLTLQYCNNLINVGVLKQISEKNDLETFKPFQMYQWTHTEVPTTSQPHTPGKLDKVTSWPYCSTPASGKSRIPKAVQVDTPLSEKETEFLQMLRKKLLTCSCIAEVHALVNDILPEGDSLKRKAKRCMLLTDLINASEATLYQYDKSNAEASFSCGRKVQEAEVQTEELLQAVEEFVCKNCKNNKKYVDRGELPKLDKEIQVFINGEDIENNQNKHMAVVPSQSSTDCLVQLCPTVSKPLLPPPPPPPPPPPAPSIQVSRFPPPPPPLPSIVGPTPPLQTSSSLTTTAVAVNTVAPSTSATKLQTTSTPPPLPNPAEGSWFNQTNTLRKIAVNPPKPMKPLYWTRIVTPPPPPKPVIPVAAVALGTSDTTDSSTPSTFPDELVAFESPPAPKEIWQEIDETKLDNIDEFTELFSRAAVVPKEVPKVKKPVRTRPVKVLDSKRSQNLGILVRSCHVDFCEIEHAIYQVDTSVVSLETLQQINKNKATNEELELIKKQGDIILDEPEQFLLKISQISLFTERISCMVFIPEFEETVTLIERKLEVIIQLSQFLMESEELKLIFAIILTLGNYMNGGNRQRGQADGFTLEILSKLKDVKSKDSQTTLLHFIVRTYISRKRKEGVQLLEIPLPIPDPSDVERATQVNFDEIKGQITKLNGQLKAIKRTTDKVIAHSTAQTVEPFKLKMEKFILNASKEIDKLLKELADCRHIFIEAMKFYHYIPKSGTIQECKPETFFEHWTNFTNDFKDIMKKEIALLWNELLKKSKDVQTRKTVKTTKVKPGGLKERIMRLNKK